MNRSLNFAHLKWKFRCNFMKVGSSHFVTHAVVSQDNKSLRDGNDTSGAQTRQLLRTHKTCISLVGALHSGAGKP